MKNSYIYIAIGLNQQRKTIKMGTKLVAEANFTIKLIKDNYQKYENFCQQ